MNYVAACVCFPIFFFIFLLDAYFCWFARTRPIAIWQKVICAGCTITSFLQWFSLIFWVVGFVKDEAGGTPSSCRNLVTAEIIIFIFQWVFTLTTFFLLLVLIHVYRDLNKVAASTPRGLYAIFIFVTLLTFSWIPVQAYTPWNDWCAGENKLLLNLYQPANVIWCILDVASSLGIVGMFFLLHRKLTLSVQSISHLRDVSESGSVKIEAPKPKADVSDKQRKIMAQHVKFSSQQAVVSILSMTIAGLIFNFQYNHGMTSDLVCIFCVLLYSAYAIRRVPMSWHFSGYRSYASAKAATSELNSSTDKSHSEKASTIEAGNVAQPL